MRGVTSEYATDQARVRRRRRFLVVGLVALALLVVAGIGVWRALRVEAPTLLGDRTGVGFETSPRPLSRAAGFGGLALPGSGTVEELLTFRGVPSIAVSANTAAATARVAICVRADNVSPVLSGDISKLDTACSEVHYVEKGTRLRWGEMGLDHRPRQYLIIVVRPTKPGDVTVDRVVYDYERASGERGTDVGTVGYTIHAT